MSRILFRADREERPDRALYSAIEDTSNGAVVSPPSLAETQERRKSDPSIKHHFPTFSDHLDIIQFTANIYIVSADEGKIELDIMRLGKSENHLSFNYATKNISAVAGRMFLETKGTLTMKPGEDSTKIEVPILNDPLWNPTTEFMVVLSQPKNCQLGLYLKVARIKIIDATPFPSNTFKEDIARGAEGLQEINKFHLFGVFVHRMWYFDNIWWKTILTLLLDQMSNVYVYIKLWASIYMVDTVFNMKTDAALIFAHDRLKTSWYVAFLLLAPMAPIYLGEVLKIRLDIEGNLSRDFSRQIFGKLMNFTKESREDVPTTDMVNAVTLDAAELTAGYGKVITIARLAGKIAISVFFTLHKNPDVWWALLIVPIAMFAWGYYRTHVYIDAIDATGNVSSDVSQFVSDMLSRISLIADYQQRPQINTLFSERAESLRQVKVPETSTLQTNMFIPQLIGPALVALYTAVGANLVLSNRLKMGVFLATLSVFGEICDAFSEAFGLSMEIISILDPLRDMTELLNKPIEAPIWKRVSVLRRARTKELRAEVLEKRKKGVVDEVAIPRRERRNSLTISDGLPSPFVPAADKLNIQLEQVTFNYQNHEPIPGFIKASIMCPQGLICSVLGPPQSGRKTLLELLSNKIFPTSGSIFVPSHLRILYVSSDPAMFNLSVWDNLVFGNKEGHDPYRIEKILIEWDMFFVLDLVKDDMAADKIEFDKGEGRQPIHEKAVLQSENPLLKLSRTEMAKIHLCRAFVMNPEVMVLHRPFMHFSKTDPEVYHDIKDALTGHRDQRGYLMPEDDIMRRRPRTIFFTPDTREEEEIADIAWVLPESKEGTMKVDVHPCKDDQAAVAQPQAEAHAEKETQTEPSALSSHSSDDQAFEKLDTERQTDLADREDAPKDEAFQAVETSEKGSTRLGSCFTSFSSLELPTLNVWSASEGPKTA